jgi:hypothetical protein
MGQPKLSCADVFANVIWHILMLWDDQIDVIIVEHQGKHKFGGKRDGKSSCHTLPSQLLLGSLLWLTRSYLVIICPNVVGD